MTKEKIIEKAVDIISRRLECQRDQISPDAELMKLGGDSLSNIELVMDLEDGFDIHIDDDEAEALKTVKDVYGLVVDKMALVSAGA